MIRALVCALAILSAGVARAQEGRTSQPPPEPEGRATVRITLKNSDVLTGEVLDRDDQEIVIQHPIAGIVNIPVEEVISVERIAGPAGETGPPPGEDGTEKAEDEQIEESPTVEPPTLPHPPETEEEEQLETPEPGPGVPPAKWSGRVEAGLNGSTGNTNLSNFRAAASARRESESMIFDISASYRLTRRDGDESQNRLFSQARNEWRIPNTNWRYIFVQGSLELDRFRDYDARLAGTVGVGYQLIDQEKMSLVGRVGLGAAQEFGGPNGDVQPEAFAALEFRRELNDRMRLRAAAEIFPDLIDFGEFRSRVDGSLEIDLDNSASWRLRLGFENRYETNSGRAEPNDFDYFASLVYSF